MTDEIKYEKPNAVSCLQSKYDELSRLRQKYSLEIEKLDKDMGHIRAAIRVFDPDADTYDMRDTVTKPRAERGAVKRFVLTTLRRSAVPMTSRQLADAWAADLNLPNDPAAITRLRSRLTSCLKDYIKQGLVEQAGMTTDHDQWGPYKLWRIAK